MLHKKIYFLQENQTMYIAKQLSNIKKVNVYCYFFWKSFK